jgi:hypothetical protein
MRLAEFGHVPFHVSIHKVRIAFLSGSNASLIDLVQLLDSELSTSMFPFPKLPSEIAELPISSLENGMRIFDDIENPELKVLIISISSSFL